MGKIKKGVIAAITAAALGGGIVGGEKAIPPYLSRHLNQNYLDDAQQRIEQVADKNLQKEMSKSFLGWYNENLKHGQSSTYQRSLERSREALRKQIQDGFQKKKFSYDISKEPEGILSKHKIGQYQFSLNYKGEPIAYFHVKKQNGKYAPIIDEINEQNPFSNESSEIVKSIVKEEMARSTQEKVIDPLKNLINKGIDELENIVKWHHFVFLGIIGIIVYFVLFSPTITGYSIINDLSKQGNLIQGIIIFIILGLLIFLGKKH